MQELTIITVRFEGELRTFSFDPDVQEVAWVGRRGEVAPAEAMACVERDGRGLCVRAVGTARLVVPGRSGSVAGPVAVRRAATWMLGVCQGDGAPVASMYLRPLAEGMALSELWCVPDDVTLRVGRADDCELRYRHAFVSGEHARLTRRGGTFWVQDMRSSNGTAVNGVMLRELQPRMLAPGDVVQVADLTVMVGNGLLGINRPDGLDLRLPRGCRPVAGEGDLAGVPVKGPDRRKLGTFYPSPRLVHAAHRLALRVEGPPERRDGNEQPALVQMGPSFLMGMTSVFMGANAVSGLMSGANVLSTLPSLSMAVALLGGTLVWPLVSRSYERRRRTRREEARARRYASYLDLVEDRLAQAVRQQSDALAQLRRPTGDLLRMARERSSLLMSHAPSHADFLDLRVGSGTMCLDAEVTWPERGIAQDADPLWDRVQDMSRRPPELAGVPLTCSLREHAVVGILGSRDVAWEFVRGLVVQVCARYSYREVKVVLLASESERREWDCVATLPHAEDADGRRLLALGPAGLARVDRLLARMLEPRHPSDARGASEHRPHHVVICANGDLAMRSHVLSGIGGVGSGAGVTVAYLGEQLSDLPRECGYIVCLDERDLGLSLAQDGQSDGARGRACMFERADVSSTIVRFDPDIMVSHAQMRSFAYDLARVRLASADEVSGPPESVGFLELYGAGSVQHLNIGRRWGQNDASRSLSAPVGCDDRGRAWSLDLHEQGHGPHGLVAGTTGSGKSEFLVTCILSLAVSYAPNEVAFLLIDYKGGGLADAFSGTDLRLPHVAGTITNLDGRAIRRALVSVRSELRRRQRMLGDARERTGEASMDVYRYQALFRQGVLDEPLPHLVIVADEFAELKQQEPDFMEELMSAARIGRSLGVHLVLATQKPSGVVNDQIWANSRFKVALKVADVADSREMIRRDDAAHLTRPGSFCVLVGYDESYVGGQAAYAGGRYVPRERCEPRRDLSVELLDGEGQPVASLRPTQTCTATGQVSELAAVVAQVAQVACSLGQQARPLWLDPLPDRMTLDEAEGRHGTPEGGGLMCTVGLFDDPRRQRQGLLALDLASEGNLLVVGPQGSDADELLATMLLSVLRRHGADEVWVYGFDLGGGALAALEAWRQVGGVVVAGQDERTRQALRLVDALARKRRGMLEGGGRRPQVLLAFCNLAALLDEDPSLEDRLLPLLRDAPRLDMCAVATIGGANAIPPRLRACFGRVLALGLAGREAYAAALGGSPDFVPAPAPMRGLAWQGKRLLEFLGASMPADGTRPKGSSGGTADPGTPMPPPIPELPDVVLPSSMGPVPAHSVPIGLAKHDVTPRLVSCADNRVVLVMGNDRAALAAYVRGACAVWRQGSTPHAVLDLVDPQGPGPAEDNRVTCERAASELLEAVGEGRSPLDVLVVMHVAQTMELPLPEVVGRLAACITDGGAKGAPTLVLVTEAWRVMSLYEGWYRVASTQGVGLWVGGGFADQTSIRFPRVLPEFRKVTRGDEGFLVRDGVVETVRLVSDGTGRHA